jgi:O-antigen/teichoic acid export membrane protein
LALVGLAVPVVVVEDAGLRAALRRAVALARADYAHAVGSLATLLLVFVLTRLMLALLLRSQGEATDRIGLFLADLVLSPILYLGAALLYDDQAARLIRSVRPKRKRRRRRDADLHPADDADRAGGADAEVQSRPAARGQR